MLPGLLFPAGFGVGLHSSGDIILPSILPQDHSIFFTGPALWNRLDKSLMPHTLMPFLTSKSLSVGSVWRLTAMAPGNWKDEIRTDVWKKKKAFSLACAPFPQSHRDLEGARCCHFHTTERAHKWIHRTTPFFNFLFHNLNDGHMARMWQALWRLYCGICSEPQNDRDGLGGHLQHGMVSLWVICSAS